MCRRFRGRGLPARAAPCVGKKSDHMYGRERSIDASALHFLCVLSLREAPGGPLQEVDLPGAWEPKVRSERCANTTREAARAQVGHTSANFRVDVDGNPQMLGPTWSVELATDPADVMDNSGADSTGLVLVEPGPILSPRKLWPNFVWLGRFRLNTGQMRPQFCRFRARSDGSRALARTPCLVRHLSGRPPPQEPCRFSSSRRTSSTFCECATPTSTAARR